MQHTTNAGKPVPVKKNMAETKFLNQLHTHGITDLQNSLQAVHDMALYQSTQLDSTDIQHLYNVMCLKRSITTLDC